MKKERLHTSGFTIIEALLATSLIGIIVSGLVGAGIYGQETARVSAERSQASLLAEEGIEAAWNIRDDSFSLLANGAHGLDVASGQWELSGTSDVIGIYTRTLTITDVDANRKDIVSTVTWQQTPQRSGQVSVTARLTNWQDNAGTSPSPPPSPSPTVSPTPSPTTNTCVLYCIGLGYSSGTCRANPGACNKNGEKRESGGDLLCTGGPSADTCCCAP